MNKLVAILKLTRIEHSLMLILAVLVAELIVANGRLPSAVTLVLSMITPAFISMGAFAINDYYDIKVDKINKKDRPLVTRDLMLEDALYVTITSFAIGIAASYFINLYCFAIAVFFGAVSWLYSYKLKELLFWGNAYVAISMSIPFIYGNYVMANAIDFRIIIVSILIFCSGLAREIHGTIRDYRGDLKARNATNVPKKMGIKPAASLSLIFYLVAILLSAYLFFYISPFRHNIAFGILIFASDVMLLYVGIGYRIKKSQRFYEMTRNVSLAAMGLALIAFLLASLPVL